MTVTRENLGTISFKSSSRLPLNSGARVDNPVMFPPSRARLATNPLANRIAILPQRNGNGDSGFLGGTGYCRGPGRDDDVDLQTR